MPQPTESRRTRTDTGHPRAAAVVDALVREGLVGVGRAGEAHAVVASALSGRPAAETPLRRRLAEVAGYIGGALVVAAAVVFLTEQWQSLSTTARVVTLAVIGLVLFGAAVVAVRTGRTADRSGAGHGDGDGDGGVRRRLASALTCGATAAAGFAVAVAVDARVLDSSIAWLAGSAVAVGVAVGGYLLAASALGQLALAVSAVMVVNAAVEVVSPPSDLAFGLLVVTLGLGWLVLAEVHVWREGYVGLGTGCALVLLGAQLPVIADAPAWAGYLLTGAAAAAAVVGYTRRRALPYLVAAVAGTTLVVPEALLDWTDGSLGPVGALLVTGVTLLVAGLLGLRLRQEVGTPGRPDTAG